jgi:hypothetical protein
VTKYIQFSGAQRQELQNAVLDRFSSAEFEQLLAFRLEVEMFDIVAPGAFRDVVFRVIRHAEKGGWLGDLLMAVSEARPGEPRLEKLKTAVGLGNSIAAVDEGPLEAFVQDVGGLLDPEVFRTKLAQAENAVCRISYTKPSGSPYGGTGFLVGPDVVMTNYHVMRDVVDGKVQPGDVQVLFDFKLDDDGNKVNEGNPQRLADSWLIDKSPFTATDLQSLPEVPDTDTDVLDYALVRLAQPAGCLPIPTNLPGKDADGSADGDSPRGWIPVPSPQPPDLAPKSPLLLLQHPERGRMKLAWAPDSVLAINGSRTRLRHKTATLGGSSGSPCFDANFNLVALHHAGDPSDASGIPAAYNQAVPLPAIVALLGSRGLGDALGGQCGGS